MRKKNRPKVTVYILCHNYGNFLEQAIESVISQTFDDWELFVVNDGSSDNTSAVIERYVETSGGKIIPLTNNEPVGVQKAANEVLEKARGQYIIRLDADDYFDENALLVMSSFLDRNPNVGLVFPNYIYIDSEGNYLGVENRRKIGREAKLLNLPAHGACTMVRKRVLKTVGGYNESFDRQDGFDIWLKVIERHQVENIPTPLFFYRQHGNSLTQDTESLLATRAKIARQQLSIREGKVTPRIVAIIGAKNTYTQFSDIVLKEIAGKPLIDYTISEVKKVESISKIVVNTDDPRVDEYCQKNLENVYSHLRSGENFRGSETEGQVYEYSIMKLEADDFFPDIVVGLNLHSPLRQSTDIQMAIDSLLLHDVDGVISVFEDHELHYLHSVEGLTELNPAMHKQVRLEREALYVDNGSVKAFWRDFLEDGKITISRIGHMVMPKKRSIQIKNSYDAWIIEKTMEEFEANNRFSPSSWEE